MRPQVLLVFQTMIEESTAMLKGISQYEREHQPWAAFLDDQARAEKDPAWLRNKRWSGVISRNTSPTLVKTCKELRIPLVDLDDSTPFSGVPKIRPDNMAIGHLGAEHLLERRFKHFGFTGYSNDPWACERRDGFIETLRLAGHDCSILDVDYPGELTPFWDDKQTAELAAWLNQLPKPAAVMACHDMRALQVLSAAQAAGVLVPEEVAVLGANNDTIRCDLSYPPLSSVATNPYQSGYLAAETLDRLMQHKTAKDSDVRIEPVGVVTRHSTDELAIADKHVATAVGVIREHACHGITVNQVARQVTISRSHLEKKFRQYLGRSPQSEIRNVQTTRIKQLLFETDFPLKKIAELTGFEHTEYMSVMFKRITGESPGHYRKKFSCPPSDKIFDVPGCFPEGTAGFFWK